MTEKTLLLIDGSSLLFRAFYAIRDLRTRDGIYTNGVYGFLNMYLNAVEKIKPTHVAVAFDKSSKTFRTEDYEAYKGTRQETPSELSGQFGILKDVLDALHVVHLDLEGYEADDIIGTLAKQASKEGFQSVLLTGDRDYFQLVEENISVLFTKKGISELEVVDLTYVCDTYGLEPHQLIDVKGFQGDTSDNIPGVPGIGEKTAVSLIQTFGSMDGVYEHLDEVSGAKRKQNLEEFRTQAYLSRKLGTIFCSVPLDVAPKDLVLGEPDREKLSDRFARLEFERLGERFAVEKEEALTVFSARIVTTDWKELAEDLLKEEELVVALLPEESNYIQSEAYFAFFKGSKEETFVVPFKGKEKEFAEAFGKVFSSDGIMKLGYDLKETMVLLGRMNMVFSTPYKDCMIMEYLIDPSRSGYDLSGLSETYLSFRVRSREQLLGKGKKQKTFSAISEEDLLDYCAGFAQTVFQAKEALASRIAELEMTELFERIENPLVSVLADMELVGVGVDRTVLEALDAKFGEGLSQLEEKIYDHAGEVFNINSPKQLGDLLFEKLGLPSGKKTKTGFSTSAEVLEKIVDEHPIVALVLEYRKLSKLKSTYVEGLIPYINEDSRVRSIFRQNVAATGRLSSTEPNLQNIPIRTQEGRELRRVFTAAEDNLLVDCDYSQIELRILASLSEDAAMIQAFQEGADIHRKTAAQVNHIEPEEVTALERSRAKAVNFGIIYGISDYGLSRDLNISREEAKAYITKYKAGYPGVTSYMDAIVEQAKQDGFVETFYGRRRLVPELSSRNFNIRAFGERIALNTPIQGTAADIIKIAMVNVHKALKDSNCSARLVLQIHDELIVECKKEDADEVAKIVKEVMEAIDDFAVALIVEEKIGKSWYDTK